MATAIAAMVAPMMVDVEVVFLWGLDGLRQEGDLRAEVIESETTDVRPFASAKATARTSSKQTVFV